MTVGPDTYRLAIDRGPVPGVAQQPGDGLDGGARAIRVRPQCLTTIVLSNRAASPPAASSDNAERSGGCAAPSGPMAGQLRSLRGQPDHVS